MSAEDEALEEETTVVASPSDDAEDTFSPFDETSDSFAPSEIRKVVGDDGLPTQVPPHGSGMSDIPALSPDTLICMGDFSSFVTRDSFGTVTARYEAEDVVQDREGSYWVSKRGYARSTIVVEPFRPPCKHYVRQVTQLDKNPEYKDHLRLCAARRTTEGTFMTLKDVGMWACTMREPRHLESEKLITEFDLLKMQQGRRRSSHSIKGNEK